MPARRSTGSEEARAQLIGGVQQQRRRYQWIIPSAAAASRPWGRILAGWSACHRGCCLLPPTQRPGLCPRLMQRLGACSPHPPPEQLVSCSTILPISEALEWMQAGQMGYTLPPLAREQAGDSPAFAPCKAEPQQHTSRQRMKPVAPGLGWTDCKPSSWRQPQQCQRRQLPPLAATTPRAQQSERRCRSCSRSIV